MDDMSARIQRVTDDLRAIQQELNWAAIQPQEDPEQEDLDKRIRLEGLQTLKTALDQMRHFLWFYFQVVDTDSDFGQKLRDALQQKGHKDENEVESFLERMTAATDEAFLRHRMSIKNRKPN
jgi:hypothetical protein